MIPTGLAAGSDAGSALGRAFESSVTGMAVVDDDGRFTAVNLALCRMLGREASELLGRRTSEFTHPDDQNLSAATVRALFRDGVETDQRRKRFLRPDGSIVHVIRTVTVLRDGCGRHTGALTQMLDVTGLTEAEGALRHSELRLEALLAQSSELTVLLDEHGRVTYASPASERMLGHRPEVVVGTEALSWLHPDELDQAAAVLADRLAGGADRASAPVYRVRHSDGTWRRAEVRTTNAFDDPAVGAIIVHLRDVTDEHDYREEAAAGAARLERLVGSVWDVLTLHGADGRCRYASPAVTAQLGWTPDEVVAMAPFALVHPDDTALRAAFVGAVGGGAPGRVDTVQYRMRHRDGTWRWVESTVGDRLADPAVRGVVVVTRDIGSRRRRAAQQEAVAALSGLAVRGEALDALYQQAVDVVAAVLEVDDVSVLAVSDGGRFELLCAHGAPGDEAGAAPRCAVATRALAAGGPVVWSADEALAPCDGRLDLRSGAAAPIGGDSGPVAVLSCHGTAEGAFGTDDLAFIEATANVLAAATRRKHMDEELRRQACSDDLTGLPNRTALRDRLVAALEHGSAAVLLIDADDFKLINDSLGHAAGDRIVVAVAERLSRNLRKVDTVGRFGGDEFVVLCEGVTASDAGRVAERLRQVLTAPLELDGRQISMTVSIGYVVARQGADPDDVIARADTAMYAAKQAGKDRVAQFDDAMRRKVTDRLAVASGLRRAVQRDELRLHYQPVFDVRTQRLVGAEALLRWQHPNDGLLGPDRFIAYAEESGLILPVGRWVLEQAMRQAAAWADLGFTGRVAINVSAHQLADVDFLGTVCGALEGSGADTANVAIEVTESGVMADLGRAADVLGQLRALGLHVGMDDFGTGHSSLSYLATLPFDFVKIDRSFVARSTMERRAAALLETIATLCRSLELASVAEGVETPEQLAAVERLGIGQVQGYLLGRPLPAEQFPLELM
ncbi:MAG TPA: EAL domain-containing protein [Acidimicrobiales bacterium]|nr:EAL domain-containing protein [Acidimicrobiales bacterium]